MLAKKFVIFLAVIALVALVACTQSQTPSGYASYNPSGGGGGGQQYVGGGCGVATDAPVEQTPVNSVEMAVAAV